jgi:hypothetical protein
MAGSLIRLLKRLLRRKFSGGFSSSATTRASSIGSTGSALAARRLEFHSIHTQRPRNAPVNMTTAIVAGSIVPPYFGSVMYLSKLSFETSLARMTSCGLRVASRPKGTNPIQFPFECADDAFYREVDRDVQIPVDRFLS